MITAAGVVVVYMGKKLSSPYAKLQIYHNSKPITVIVMFSWKFMCCQLRRHCYKSVRDIKI